MPHQEFPADFILSKEKTTGKTGSEREILRHNKFPIYLPYHKHLCRTRTTTTRTRDFQNTCWDRSIQNSARCKRTPHNAHTNPLAHRHTLVLSLSLVLFFLFLSLAIPFLFSPGNYSGSGNLFLSFLYSLSLVLFLSFSLSVIVVGGERGSVIGEGEKSEWVLGEMKWKAVIKSLYLRWKTGEWVKFVHE